MVTSKKPSVGPLILKRGDLQRDTAALFANLREDASAREQFIKDPARHLSERVIKQQLPPQRISDANRVLFTMLANDGFRHWLDEYQANPSGKQVSQEQFGSDFAKAVLQFGDSDLLNALFKHAADGFGLPGINAQQLVTGPDKTVVTSPATPSTSDKSAKSSSNSNGIQLGDPSLVDPAFFRAVIGQMITHAKELKAGGKLADVRANVG